MQPMYLIVIVYKINKNYKTHKSTQPIIILKDGRLHKPAKPKPVLRSPKGEVEKVQENSTHLLVVTFSQVHGSLGYKIVLYAVSYLIMKSKLPLVP